MLRILHTYFVYNIYIYIRGISYTIYYIYIRRHLLGLSPSVHLPLPLPDERALGGGPPRLVDSRQHDHIVVVCQVTLTATHTHTKQQQQKMERKKLLGVGPKEEAQVNLTATHTQKITESKLLGVGCRKRST